MPQVEVSASARVKEDQADTVPAGDLSITFKDNFVEEYDGGKRVSLKANSTRTINVDHLTTLRTVGIVNTTASTTFRLRLRLQSAEPTESEIGRFYFADVRNVQQIRLENKGATDIVLRVFLAGEPSEGS